MAQDKLNVELKRGDIIAYATSRGGDIQLGVVLEAVSNTTNYSGTDYTTVTVKVRFPVIKYIHLKQHPYTITGEEWKRQTVTFKTASFVIIPRNIIKPSCDFNVKLLELQLEVLNG